jgi:hypothetical protein
MPWPQYVLTTEKLQVRLRYNALMKTLVPQTAASRRTQTQTPAWGPKRAGAAQWRAGLELRNPAPPCVWGPHTPVVVDMAADDVAHVTEAHARLAGGDGLHHGVVRHLDQALADVINLRGTFHHGVNRGGWVPDSVEANCLSAPSASAARKSQGQVKHAWDGVRAARWQPVRQRPQVRGQCLQAVAMRSCSNP